MHPLRSSAQRSSAQSEIGSGSLDMVPNDPETITNELVVERIERVAARTHLGAVVGAT